ncbi:putative cyclase/dehydratase [Mycobacterium intracellulare 1956]|uniref:Putative cyclase/dehydratase n=1 Tax=Mycobacterium intracellulare 1956 TaxID=1299331 RepID=X8CEX9_MYCIT|nr:putative cyclase/dehydratase [Mycobacterium intracellulare 1956]
MPVLSKTVEIGADAGLIMKIVGDFEAYPQWNEEIKGLWVLARYDDGRPSQLRLDTDYQGMQSMFIQAVYYPGKTRSRPSCSRATCSPSRSSSSPWWPWALPAC